MVISAIRYFRCHVFTRQSVVYWLSTDSRTLSVLYALLGKNNGLEVTLNAALYEEMNGKLDVYGYRVYDVDTGCLIAC